MNHPRQPHRHWLDRLRLALKALLASRTMDGRMWAPLRRWALAEPTLDSELALVARHTSNAVIITDADDRIRWVNEGFSAISGYSLQEALGHTPSGLLGNPKADPAVVAQLDHARAAGLPCRVEVLDRAKDGHDYWVEVNMQPMRDAQGALRGFLEVDSDISVRKLAESELRESESQLRLIAETMPAMVVHYDKDLICRYANRPYAALLNRPLGEVIGRPMAELLDPTLVAREQHLIRSVLSGESVRFERELHDEAARTLDVTVVPYLRPDGVQDGYFGFAVDITELKNYQAQLREAQKMQAMGTLAGGIAHDFNNIIAATLGNAALARQDVEAGRVAQALESIGEIELASVRARNLVQQILTFSRRQPMERERAALAPALQEVGRLLRATLPARLRLSIHCDPQAPLVLADLTQIEQVLLNLATNAMQALGSAAGHIQLRLDAQRPDAALAQSQMALSSLLARHRGPLARLQVIDDGPGMDQATMQRAFEPFFTTKPMGEGTGLGLSVVRGIVQAHEGEILLESAPGQGATFSIYLPGVPEPIAQPDLPMAEAVLVGTGSAGPPGRRQHLLYLDDDEAMVFLVKRLLEQRGFSVSAFDNPHEALAALLADPASFDLLVSDYNMPGLSGLDVARRARDIRADLPLVLVSGFIDETLAAKAQEVGVLEVIFKASDVEAFCAAIRRHAEPRQQGR